MGRSLGFGSHTRHKRALHTRFRSGFGSLAALNPATAMHSPDHSTKGTPSGMERPLTAWEDKVSGSLSFPLPGCFSPFPHGTRALSVVQGTSPWKVVLPASHTVPRAAWYSGCRRGLCRCCYRTGTFCGVSFEHFASQHMVPMLTVLQPRCEVSLTRFGREPRSLATTCGLSFDSCSSGY